MKKIGLWMAALTAVTVGGVYATFNYAGNFKDVSKTEARMVSVTEASTTTAAGSYAITVTSLDIVIDSAKTLGKVTEEKPEENRAYMQVSGEILVTFTPHANIDPIYADNGIPSKFSFSTADTANNWTYKATNPEGQEETSETWMFTVADDKEFVIGMASSEENLKWTPSSDGKSFTCAIPYRLINDNDDDDSDGDVLKFNSDIILETKKEHDDFYAAVLKNSLKITVKADIPTV